MWKKILLILLFFILLLPFAVWLAAPGIADSKLRGLLEKADTASYSYMELDFWAGDLVLHDIYLHDTTGNIMHQPVKIVLNRLSIKGADLWKAYRQKELAIDSIELGKGVVQLPLSKKDTIETEKKKKPLPVHQLNINHFQIDSIGFDLLLNPNNAEERFAGTVTFSLDSLRIPLKKEGQLNYENASLVVSNIYAQPKKSVAWFTLDSLVFSGNNHALLLHNLKMRQRIDQNNYATYFGFDKNYIKLDVYRAEIHGLPSRLASLSNGIHLPYISILGMQAYFYKDRRLPHPTNEKKFIVEMLSEVDIPIRLDTLDLIDGQLLFNENWREDRVPGRLALTDMQVRVLNLNNRGPTENGDWAIFDGSVTLYDRLNLDVDWRFDLRTNGKAFTLDLGIGQTNFSVLNPFTENTVGVRFKDGYLQGGRMYVEANKQSGAGTLDLNYKHLKVEFLDKEDHHQNIVKWAEGGLANLVVRNNNEPGKRERQGIVYAEPIRDRAIFGYIMRMFFSGFKDIALSSKNEAKVAERGMEYLPMPNLAQEIQEKDAAAAEKQKEKATRKEERKARREARKKK